VRKEVKVGDYMIPEGAMLMYNTYSLHMDPAHWKDPENFRPDRYQYQFREYATYERYCTI